MGLTEDRSDAIAVVAAKASKIIDKHQPLLNLILFFIINPSFF
jgi:hypothetical protein